MGNFQINVCSCHVGISLKDMLIHAANKANSKVRAEALYFEGQSQIRLAVTT